MPLASFPRVWMRKDPPVDEAYLYATHLLELAERQGVRVLNRPASLRAWNEKLSALRWSHLMAPTLVATQVEALAAFADYIQRRMQLPFFANARSIRNAIDRARMRQANRLFKGMGKGGLTKLDLMTIEAEDITASRVFSGEVEGLDPAAPITG